MSADRFAIGTDGIEGRDDGRNEGRDHLEVRVAATVGFACSFLALGVATETAFAAAREAHVAATIALMVLGAVFEGMARRRKAMVVEALSSSLRPRSDHAAVLHRIAGIVLVTIGLLTTPMTGPIRFFAMTLWFAGCGLLTGGRRSTTLALTAWWFGLFGLATTQSLLGWYGLREASSAISQLAGSLAGVDQEVMPTFSGVRPFVLAVVAIVATSTLNRRSRRTMVTAIGIAIVMLVVYLQLLALVSMIDVDAVVRPLRAPAQWLHSLAPLHLGWMLLLWLSLPVVMTATGPSNATRKSTTTPPASTSSLLRFLRRPGPVIACASVASILAVAAETSGPTATAATSTRRPVTVAFHTAGFVNWLVPNRHRYGSYSAGMAGNLPRFVEAKGWTTRMVDGLTAESLDGVDILCIINQDDVMAGDTRRIIDEFVAAGGGLLVVGDHTSHWHDQLVLNHPLENTNVRFRFDNAEFFIGGWFHSYDSWRHPITAACRDRRNEVGNVIGASLEVNYPALPLVVGRLGYSDPGDVTADDNGYMGNREFDTGDRLGDAVLVAAETVGEGRVVVVGDTTGFCNGMLTQTWPYVSRVFEWLADPDGRAALPWWRDVAGLLLLVLAAWGGGVVSREVWMLVPLAMVGFGAVVVADRIVVDGAVPPPLVATGEGDEHRPIAYVDNSGLGAYSMTGHLEDGISGVYLNLMREGYLVLGGMSRDAEQLREASLLVAVAPTRRFDDADVAELTAFMKRGGVVLLAAGYDRREAVLPLIEPLGIDLVHRPLGQSAGAVDGIEAEANPWSAWAIRGGEPVARIWEYPFCVRERVGEGGLILVADDGIFSDKKLENRGGPVMKNIVFLRHLITLAKEWTS